MDHKPLTFVIISSSKHHSPHQIRHLDFITQFTTDIRFLKGSSNVAADALSCLEMDAIHTVDRQTIDFTAMARAQQEDQKLQNAQDSSLQLHAVHLPTADATLLCDMSMGTP